MTRVQYQEYCKLFQDAADELGAGFQLAGATRFLAIKQPQNFVCVNSMNQKLAVQLSIKGGKIDSFDGYWEQVIVPIRSSPWYNSPRPVGADGILWDRRVAMVDALFYGN